MRFSLRQRLLAAMRLQKARLGGGHLAWGRNVYIGHNSAITARKTLVIGDNVYIGRNVTIEVEGSIGNGCLIANNVGIIGRRDHDPEFRGDMFFAPHASNRPDLRLQVVIEDGVWVGYGAVILSGVRIGARSIVSAGAVVTRDVPPLSLVRRFDIVEPRFPDSVEALTA